MCSSDLPRMRQERRCLLEDAALGQRQNQLLVSFATDNSRHDRTPIRMPAYRGLFDRMGGLPGGGPRLAHIPQMARKTADFQPYGAVGSEAQDD